MRRRRRKEEGSDTAKHKKVLEMHKQLRHMISSYEFGNSAGRELQHDTENKSFFFFFYRSSYGAG